MELHKIEERTLQKRRYKLAVELVELFRQYGLLFRVRCPRCGEEGTLSTLVSQGYVYLVVRHPSKNTHTIPRRNAGEILCTIEQTTAQILTEMLEIYKKHTNNGDAKLCTEANLDLNQHSQHEAGLHGHRGAGQGP
jgi:hypothetical protein